MKKVISVLLTVMLVCLCFTACGGSKTISKEEMLETAEEYSVTNIQNDSVNNIVNAKQKYCNKTLLLYGYVRHIKEDHIELCASYSANYMVDVFLPLEELSVLQDGQIIKVVGITTDEIKDDSEIAAEFTFEYKHYQMPSAYLVEDRVTVEGTLKGMNKNAYNILIGTSNVYKLVYFADSVDTSEFTFGTEVKFSAKGFVRNNNIHYYEAEIID